EQIDDSTFCTMNDDAPTRIMGSCSSSPDLTIGSAGLINSISRRPMLTLASDHLPIIISINKPTDFAPADHRTYTNFNKADWDGFAEVTESSFAALPTPTNIHTGECQFRRVVTAAAARFIPSGRIAEVRPNFPAEAAVDPGDPRLRDLNLEIRQLVNQHKRKKWEEHLKACNFTSDVSKLSLSNPTKRDDRVEISFECRASSDPKKGR
ncbi:uncharacterized protein LOC118756004, partial [Rhagoletis pomonella]|uniref:uncharacterized protein LOC118756004 n=1 Tax=Rhagoletis pomonella TaxID=28610 RepID=UPI0017832735